MEIRINSMAAFHLWQFLLILSGVPFKSLYELDWLRKNSHMNFIWGQGLDIVEEKLGDAEFRWREAIFSHSRWHHVFTYILEGLDDMRLPFCKKFIVQHVTSSDLWRSM